MSLVEKIETVLPQRLPFVVIGELIHCVAETSVSAFDVMADYILLIDNQLHEPSLVENMAQTAAARAGFLAMQEKRPVSIGYIGAIQNLEIFDLPVLGDRLETEIRVLNQVFDVTLISAAVICKGKKMASC